MYPKYRSGGVEIKMVDGREFRHHETINRGAGERALNAEEIETRYPDKPIPIGTCAAEGGHDFVARSIAREFSAPLGQPMIVDDRPAIALGGILAKAPPDGYTLPLSL